MFADRTKWDLRANRLSQAVARARAAGGKLLDLTASNPTECGFSYDQPAILQALSRPEGLKYNPDPHGLASARQAVCEYYAGRRVNVTVEDIVLTTSTSEAYTFAFRLLCNPGDEVLIPTPSYPLFDFLADLQDVKLIRYPLLYDHGWQIDFHVLEQVITARTRAIIVVHPNNPTGHFCKQEEMSRLHEICAARKMAIIADEVFLDFNLAANGLSANALSVSVPPSFAAHHGNSYALTFTMSGLSKISGLPQMKLAWLIAGGPEGEKREALARLEVIADTYLSLNTPVQLAAPVLLEERHSFQKQLMSRVRENLAELDLQLKASQRCRRLEVEGGWYAVLRVPATRPDEDLAIELLEKHNVYVHPGHFYDFPGDGYLVVSLITPEEEFKEGLSKVLACA